MKRTERAGRPPRDLGIDPLVARQIVAVASRDEALRPATRRLIASFIDAKPRDGLMCLLASELGGWRNGSVVDDEIIASALGRYLHTLKVSP